MGRKEWYQTNNYIDIFTDIVQYFILYSMKILRNQIHNQTLNAHLYVTHYKPQRLAGFCFSPYWAILCMGESFQVYSWVQDFEADFP